MENVIVLITGIFMGLLLQWPAAQVCYRNKALMTWRGVLAFSAVLWAAMPAIKLLYLNDIFPPGDGAYHEHVARKIAESLVSGRYSDIAIHFGYGNRGYRFLLGVFYAFTGAPEVVTYAIHASLAFLGMVTLLHVLCRQTDCDRVPLWLILITVFLPSALFWAPNNLKEGLCLWGICMMLRATLRDPWTGARESTVLPILGFVAVAFQRPHFAMAFATAVGLGLLVSEKKLRHVFVIGVSVTVGFQVLQLLKPELVNEFQQEGVVDTLASSYESNNHRGGSAIQHPGGVPIPVVTGLTLIFLRPFPHEISGIAGAMAAVEVWFITAICMWGWLKLPNRRSVLRDPFTVTLLAAILFMALFFSYMYNMGLMVRQRLHVLPAVIALTAIPHLLPRNPRPVVEVDLEARRPDAGRMVPIG